MSSAPASEGDNHGLLPNIHLKEEQSNSVPKKKLIPFTFNSELVAKGAIDPLTESSFKLWSKNGYPVRTRDRYRSRLERNEFEIHKKTCSKEYDQPVLFSTTFVQGSSKRKESSIDIETPPRMKKQKLAPFPLSPPTMRPPTTSRRSLANAGRKGNPIIIPETQDENYTLEHLLRDLEESRKM